MSALIRHIIALVGEHPEARTFSSEGRALRYAAFFGVKFALICMGAFHVVGLICEALA